MSIVPKIYYELSTGDVILIVHEKHGINTINTTKEQDFMMYDVLQARTPESVGLKQLEYGEYRAELQSAISVKVNLQTTELLFQLPVFDPPITSQVQQLSQSNDSLIQQLAQKDSEITTLTSQVDALTLEILQLKGLA